MCLREPEREKESTRDIARERSFIDNQEVTEGRFNALSGNTASGRTCSSRERQRERERERVSERERERERERDLG